MTALLHSRERARFARSLARIYRAARRLPPGPGAFNCRDTSHFSHRFLNSPAENPGARDYWRDPIAEGSLNFLAYKTTLRRLVTRNGWSRIVNVYNVFNGLQ